jgi:hypothetical protein
MLVSSCLLARSEAKHVGTLQPVGRPVGLHDTTRWTTVRLYRGLICIIHPTGCTTGCDGVYTMRGWMKGWMSGCMNQTCLIHTTRHLTGCPTGKMYVYTMQSVSPTGCTTSWSNRLLQPVVSCKTPLMIMNQSVLCTVSRRSVLRRLLRNILCR